MNLYYVSCVYCAFKIVVQLGKFKQCDGKPKYLNGTEKRKLKEESENEIRKLLK